MTRSWSWRKSTGRTVPAVPRCGPGHWGAAADIPRPACLALSPDGQYMATSSRDKTVASVGLGDDARTGCAAGAGSRGPVSLFSPDGTLLAVGGRESFSVVVDLTDARHVVTLPSHRADVRSVAFSPDGSLIASVGDDCAVRLWSPRTASSQKVFAAHAGRVWAAAFSPDGKTLAMGGEDRTVRVADLAGTLPGVLTSRHYAAYGAMAFCPIAEHWLRSIRRINRIGHRAQGRLVSVDLAVPVSIMDVRRTSPDCPAGAASQMCPRSLIAL